MMTVQIPLRYSEKVFGYARVDDDAELLRDLGYYSVTLPKSLRKMAKDRPDVMLAHLREDIPTFRKCTPFISLFGTQILLVHMIVRNSLARYILDSRFSSRPKEMITPEINQIRGSIGRISYANGDRTDCTRANIRELV